MTTKNRRLIVLALLICFICYFQARRIRWLGELGYAMDLISELYYSKVDRKDLYSAAMRGMTSELDRYSGYIESEEYNQFQRMMEQQFGGIGIMIDGPPRVEKLVVVTPLYDTPAYRAGLEPGDRILEVDHQSVAGMDVDEASKLMKGPEGSAVHLLIDRDGFEKPREFTMKRAAIELESVVGDQRRKDSRWSFRLEDDPSIGYIRITSFGEKTVREMKEAIQAMKTEREQAVCGLILDLRDNPGGLMTSATDICDMFLESGTIVSTKGRDGRFETRISAEPGVLVDSTIPMVVIVNDQSASAAEIVSACLQDAGRAKVAGQRSFGKGSVQNVVELDGGKSALKLTTARYFPPSGRNIHRGDEDKEEDVWGVCPTPQLQVDISDEQRRRVFQRWRERGATESAIGGEDLAESDPQLAKAVEYLENQIEGLQSTTDSSK